MNNRNRLPDWLYEPLPYAYAIAGLITILVLRNAMAVFSGLALISAGGTIWMMRRRYRQAAREMVFSRREEEDPFASAEPREDMDQLCWRSSIETGHPVIDSQHRRLFGMSNELIKAVLADRPRQDIGLMLDELLDHVAGHFQIEEQILAELCHPLLAEHRALHRSLLGKARGLMRLFEQGQAPLGEVVGFMVYSLVLEHTVKDDQRFAGDVIPKKTDQP